MTALTPLPRDVPEAAISRVDQRGITLQEVAASASGMRGADHKPPPCGADGRVAPGQNREADRRRPQVPSRNESTSWS